MRPKQRKAKNGVVDKHHRMEGNAIRRPRETGSRSGAMEDHDSQHSQRRRHLMMTMQIHVKLSYMPGISLMANDNPEEL